MIIICFVPFSLLGKDTAPDRPPRRFVARARRSVVLRGGWLPGADGTVAAWHRRREKPPHELSSSFRHLQCEGAKSFADDLISVWASYSVEQPPHCNLLRLSLTTEELVHLHHFDI